MSDNEENIDYNDVINRIKKIYAECQPSDKVILKKILQEISDTGYSDTYKNLWLADYKEIPVDKYTFLTDPYYLGGTNNNGKSIYPAWMNTMLELERTGNKYYEIVFTGATRTGKTSTAVSDCAYNLYKLMCLKDPQKYFGLKSVTTISIFFFNLTEALAKGVAYREFNSTLSLSPWFMDHGKMSNSTVVPTYLPDNNLIRIEFGSGASQALGKATYCIVGSTEILTDTGYQQIKDLVGKDIKVGQYTPDGELIFVPACAIFTKYAVDTIQVELEDGTIIEGTPDHKVLLTTGNYKALQDLDIDDEIQTT
jgi:hypothetical protein